MEHIGKIILICLLVFFSYIGIIAICEWVKDEYKNRKG